MTLYDVFTSKILKHPYNLAHPNSKKHKILRGPYKLKNNSKNRLFPLIFIHRIIQSKIKLMCR